MCLGQKTNKHMKDLVFLNHIFSPGFVERALKQPLALHVEKKKVFEQLIE